MNPMQMLLGQLQNQLKAKNPQVFQQFQSLQKKQNNPQEILNKMMSGYSPAQMQQFQKFANGFGISNEQLENYGIKANK